MAAHVFDATEPSLDSTRNRPIETPARAAAAAPQTDGPMFAAQPAVFHRMQTRTRVGAGPLIGLAVGAALIGGLVFAMSKHSQTSNGALTGHHTISQAPAGAAATANPVPSPTTNEANPGPVTGAFTIWR